MPIYLYRCNYCGREEPRIAGVDDRHATCTECHNVMTRIINDEDIYKPYWYECLYDSPTENKSKKSAISKVAKRRRANV